MAQSDGTKERAASFKFNDAVLQASRWWKQTEAINHQLEKYVNDEAIVEADAAMLGFS